LGDVTVAVVYPDLLGTYGDGGNGLILCRRLQWRDIPASMLTITLGTTLPKTCDIYVLGGGEDAPQALAATTLNKEGGLKAAVDNGAAVLAVCAGFQVIGNRFRTSEGIHDGVGLVDAETVTALNTRAVGELVVERDTTLLTGYENHASATTLGSATKPLGKVVDGVGNGNAVDGCIDGKVLGTYMHGPVLARNPDVADLILSWVVGPLRPIDDAEAEGLRNERLSRSRRKRRYHLGT
jgi:CobQ-like glutamine amidotransferase family enzyme